MESLQEYLSEYRKQLEKGYIQKAYRGLMEYILDLKTYFKNKYPNYFISGSLYYGYMDMTYFSFIPESFKQRNLKVAIVFNYDKFRFEVWLAGYNKQVQQKYWKLFKESNWSKYRIPSAIKGVDSIVEATLVDNPDFSDLDALTSRIEKGTLVFISNIEDFLSRH
ncbi:MAG: hypothetical protein PHU23_14495 [Dehalococcoidales bacterium]|nr:hypothetical protein [Dehalococcoidales bacterium]